MATAAKNPALNQSNRERKHTIHRDRGTVRDAEPKVIADRMHPDPSLQLCELEIRVTPSQPVVCSHGMFIVT